MAEVTKCWKLTECVAHPNGQVTCLSLGQANGSILATGGEDKLVKLWVVGRTTCVMSLSGHTSSIESLRFNLSEDKLAAGSMSGVIKTWDLNEAKLMRSLSGHKAAVAALDLHPYGDFAVSGCVDGSAKLWDIRRKGCIYTYKGHTQPVRCVKFSPDGRWIVTAGDDAVIKIWDLENGKTLAELSDFGSAATDISFHPSVLLMAVALQDRTVKFLDLEVFQSIGSTQESDMSTFSRRVTFNPDGSCLYACSGDSLKVLSVEPTTLLETVPVGWGRQGVADMAVSTKHQQLIGASYSHGSVTTYVVDVRNCAPFVQPPAASAAAIGAIGGAAAADAGGNGRERPLTMSGRKSFNQPQAGLVPKTKPHKQKQSAAATPDDDGAAETQILDEKAYHDIFAPKRTLRRSPSPEASGDERRADKPFTPPTKESPQHQRREPATPQPALDPSPPSARRPATQQQQQQQPPPSRDPDADASNGRRRGQPNVERPAEVAVDDFLPKSPPSARPAADRGAAIGGRGEPELSEEELVQRFRNPHSSLLSVIGARQKQLQRIRSLWTSESVKAAIDCAMLMHDQAIFVDIINVLLGNQSLWTLELSAAILPAISGLFSSKYAAYVETGASASLTILRLFAPLIKSTMSAASAGYGVDITREERLERCRACYDAFMRINSSLANAETLTKAGQPGREVKMLLLQLQL